MMSGISPAVTVGSNSRLRLITWAPWLDRVADPACAIVTASPQPFCVEHADRHDRRAVRQPGQPEAVVGRLGDRAGDERPVALAIERVAVVRDEVVRVDEARAGEVGRSRNWCQLRYATPVSSIATTTPRPPGRWSASRFAHACGALTPSPGRKFHCSCSHPCAACARARDRRGSTPEPGRTWAR